MFWGCKILILPKSSKICPNLAQTCLNFVQICQIFPNFAQKNFLGDEAVLPASPAPTTLNSNTVLCLYLYRIKTKHAICYAYDQFVH